MYPKVSVIVPVYNPGVYFPHCVESLLDQTYKNLEIILIDDGSTDGSGDLCDQYAERDQRVISVHQKNTGVSAARNKGLECCTGEYIHFMDSDDFLENNAYESLLACIEREQCDVAVCEYYIDFPDSAIKHKQSTELYRICTGEEAAARLFTGFQFACTKLFPRKIIDDLRFREDIYRGEDTLFAAEALLRMRSVCYLDTPLYHYVQSEESACRGKFRTSQLSIIKLYDAYDCLYKKYHMTIPKLFWTYMHDNLIMIYYDMWSDKEDHREGKKLVLDALRKYYRQSCSAVRNEPKKIVKFFLATYFPNLFCQLHKEIHKL